MENSEWKITKDEKSWPGLVFYDLYHIPCASLDDTQKGFVPVMFGWCTYTPIKILQIRCNLCRKEVPDYILFQLKLLRDLIDKR